MELEFEEPFELEFDEPLELEFDALFELEFDELFELEFDELLELEFDEPLELEFEELFELELPAVCHKGFSDLGAPKRSSGSSGSFAVLICSTNGINGCWVGAAVATVAPAIPRADAIAVTVKVFFMDHSSSIDIEPIVD